MPVSREEQAGVGNGEWWGIEIAVEIAQTVRFLYFASSPLQLFFTPPCDRPGPQARAP